MTTTIMRDSQVGDQWLQAAAAAVPIQRVLNDQGQPTNDFLTGPVRLSWPVLFKLPQPSKDNANPKFGAALLFTPLADFSLLYEEYYRVCAASFADCYDAGSNQYYGLRSPFRDQGEKIKFEGYTPGCVFITCSTKFKPPVVDNRGNPVVDENKVYPGVWAICGINAYPNLDARTKGVRFGLQTVMLIGDDKNLGGAGADPAKTFKGINVAAPLVRPDMAKLMPSGQQQPGMGAPAPRPAPPIPQQTYTPPAPQPVQEDDDMSWMN